MSRQSEIKLQPPGASDLVLYMNSQTHSHIEALYWNVSPLAIEGVLAHIRNDLVKLVAEIRAATPSSAEIPSAETATTP